ncbi:site-specific integrase [bacterium]|nr:site-specific integrase [bacterium]
MKDTVEFWMTRIRPMPSDCRPGWFVELQRHKRRERFNLGTENKREAATKAREIYRALVANGWETALAEFKPASLERAHRALVAAVATCAPMTSFGQWFEATTAICPTRKLTHANNIRACRSIIADIKNIDGKRNAAWRAAVDAVPLADIHPKTIQRWMATEAAVHASNPARQAERKSGLNSTVRQARSLWSRKLVDLIPNSPPSPFEGVRLFPKSECTDTHYVSCGRIRNIVAEAVRELGAPWREGERECNFHDRMQVWKIFLFALFAGLRKMEIDTLLTERIDWTTGRIDMRPSKYYAAKSASSRKPALLEVEALAFLRQVQIWVPAGEFIIDSRFALRPDATDRHYRCREHFAALQTWLRGHGIKDKKPLHALRKELGDLVNETGGLVAASARLRHGDTRITEEHYVDRSRLISSGIGEFLQLQRNKNTDQHGDIASSN